jgi:hypothetical protein
MADADKQLKILIELGVIGESDVRVADALLDETKGKTKEVTKETELLGLSHHELHKILHLIGKESGPEAEAALASVAAASGGGLMIGLVAVSALLELFKKLSEAVKKARDEMAKLDVEVWSRQADAIQAATTEAIKYQDRIGDVINSTDQLTQAFDRANAARAAQNTQTNELLGTEENMAVEEAKRAGATTEEIDRLKELYQHRKENAKIDQETADLAAKRTQLASDRGKNDTLAAAATASEQRKIALTGDTGAAGREAQLKALSEKTPDLLVNAFAAMGKTFMPEDFSGTPSSRQQVLADMDKQRASLQPQFDLAAKTGSPMATDFDAQIQALNKAEAKLKDNFDRTDALNRAVSDHQAALDAATHEAEEATKKWAENKAATDKLTQEVLIQTDKLKTLTGTNTAKQGMDLFGDAEKILASGGPATTRQASFLTQLAETMSGHIMTLQQAEQYLQMQAGHDDRVLGIMEANATRMKQLEDRMTNLQYRFGN